jgi:peptidoglycan/LPS O-acetylase OafA/YrhL
MVAGSYILYKKSNTYNPLCILNESPFVLAQAVLLFVGFKLKNTFKNSLVSRFSVQVSALSFGLYLVHPVVIDILDKGYWGIEIDARKIDTILSIPLTYAVVFASCFLFTYLLSKIPFVRKVIG